MRTHHHRAGAVLALLTWQLLLPFGAAAYSVKVRWDAPADASIAGYHIYVREGGDEYGPPRDVAPAAQGDGGFVTVLGDLDVERTYTFALSAYSVDGRESERSNERTIGYAEAAAVVDSDADGLPDALEDTNLNGAVDAGESDRLLADSDGDGVRDGIERARGTDPLDPADQACDTLPFADFGFTRGGTAEVAYEPAVDDTVLHATETARTPMRFRATYPRKGAATWQSPVLVTAVHSTRRFRIEIAVRSTLGKRYTLRYEGNGGEDRLSGRRLTIALGNAFAAGDALIPFDRDLAADLALIAPTAVLARVTHVRLRGGYAISALRVCR